MKKLIPYVNNSINLLCLLTVLFPYFSEDLEIIREIRKIGVTKLVFSIACFYLLYFHYCVIITTKKNLI